MTTDKAPADSAALGYAGGGDAGRGRVEHRSFRHVEVTQSVRNSLSREHEREWLERATKETPWKDGNLTLAIEDRETQEFLGTVGLSRISPENSHAEFGIAIHDPAQQGKGYGTDATETTLWIGFHELGLNSIHLYTMESNKRAQRAYRKAGFKRMGKIRQYMYSGGRYEDAIVMDILKSEFMENCPPGEMSGN